MSQLSKNDIINLLNSFGEEEQELFARASQVKLQNVGNKVYLRGLIESVQCLR